MSHQTRARTHQLQLTGVKVGSAERCLPTLGSLTPSPRPDGSQERNVQAHAPQRLCSGWGFVSPHPVCVTPSFYVIMSRGTCWAATQICLTDGVTLGTGEGPGTRQMAPGTLGFFGRASGKLPGLCCPIPLLKAGCNFFRQAV